MPLLSFITLESSKIFGMVKIPKSDQFETQVGNYKSEK
jgi:hypothetical protein